MKKLILLITIILSMTLLTGCGKDKYEVMSENLAKMELTGNLVTYQAYYHNVLEYKKDAGSGLAHIFERDRKMFAEYTGTIKLGVNLSKVKVDVVGDKIIFPVDASGIICCHCGENTCGLAYMQKEPISK